MNDEKPAEIKRAVRIMAGQLQTGIAEYARTIYVLEAKAGETPEDYADPKSYVHVLEGLKAKDRFEVTAQDNTWFAEILVLDREGQRLSLALLRKFYFERDIEKAHEEYEVKYAGPVAKWRVLRKSDQHVMTEEPLAQKSQAVAWIEANAKAPLKQAA